MEIVCYAFNLKNITKQSKKKKKAGLTAHTLFLDTLYEDVSI